MSECCSAKSCDLDRLRDRQGNVLRAVLAVNAVMFGVELVAGLLAGSVALLADSLDMLTDALIYGFSLYVVYRSARWKARAALAKALVMALSGAFVCAQLVYRTLHPALPAATIIGVVGSAALLANGACFALLYRHRADDVNMRSVWLCSRNDLLANVLVLVAAVGVWALGSPWPDLGAGAIICVVFLRSAIAVAREARAELRADEPSFGRG
jgi:cation diffusion facilitator family transporter